MSVETKPKTNVIILTNHKLRRQSNEPIKTCNCRKARENMYQLPHDWIWSNFWLDNKMAREFKPIACLGPKGKERSCFVQYSDNQKRLNRLTSYYALIIVFIMQFEKTYFLPEYIKELMALCVNIHIAKPVSKEIKPMLWISVVRHWEFSRGLRKWKQDVMWLVLSEFLFYDATSLVIISLCSTPRDKELP